MRARLNPFSIVGLAGALLAVLICSGSAFAQYSDNAANAAIASTMVFFFLGMALLGYLYVALALQTIAVKTATPNPWLAWIPIANIFLMLGIAKKPMWWFLLFLVPLLNIVIAILVWMGIAEARHKPSWWGVLTIIPIAQLIVPGYLAWAD
jgi:hypothetical protein